MRKQKLTIVYDGKPDDEIDARIAAVVEFPPLDFYHVGQGYNFTTNKRDIAFEKDVE